MSKMPAKKKSCFQITSVTQAQVAASSITDDTESLDDPDESRTEYVSSEMFEPDACDQSSFEETLNNLGETEALGAASSHIPQDVQLPAVSGPSNGGFGFRSTVVSGVVPANPHVLGAGGPSSQSHKNPVGVLQQSATFAVGSAANVSQPPPTSSVATSASTTSCGSRFRVIKLDHGTGEPFRRGRWTCTEFYEKDSESSVVQRTVDSIKHASTTDQNMDRDSGLGATVGSVATPSTLSAQGPDSNTDGSFTAQLQTAELQSYGIGHQNASGTVAHSASQPPTYTVVPSTQPLTVPAQQQISMQPPTPQSLLPPGHNGIQTFPVQQVQNSPGMLPANQTQQFAYPAQPQQHLPALIPSNPVDYRQQHLPVMQPQGTTAPTLPVSSLPTGPSVSQGPSPVMTPAASGAQVLGHLGQPGEPAGSGGGLPPCSQPAPAQGLVQHAGSGGGVPTVPAGVAQQQQSTSQPPPSGVAGNAQISISPHVVVPGVQNVPTTVPISSSTPLTMPNQALSSVGQSLTSQPQATRSGTGLAKQGLPINFGQLPLIQVDEKQRKSDALPQTSVTSGKEFTKPLIPESLQLHAPSVNSLFGMSITIDGDDDRNPSTAFYQAFPSSKLQESKTHSDSASGASVVAIDNKIEQAMDLVKSHLMYAVREEVEVLKEQIKELYERNSVLERENAVLKSLANNDQLSQLSVGLTNPCSSTSLQHPPVNPVPQEGATALPHPQQPNVSSA